MVLVHLLALLLLAGSLPHNRQSLARSESR
jgi:uncharacterized protein YhhL (DUF1145 family)